MNTTCMHFLYLLRKSYHLLQHIHIGNFVRCLQSFKFFGSYNFSCLKMWYLSLQISFLIAWVCSHCKSHQLQRSISLKIYRLPWTWKQPLNMETTRQKNFTPRARRAAAPDSTNMYIQSYFIRLYFSGNSIQSSQCFNQWFLNGLICKLRSTIWVVCFYCIAW